MEKGDVVKYPPTGKVGKILDVKEEDGDVWVKLDVTGLYYRRGLLVPASASEYKTTSFKERESKPLASRESVDDLKKMEREVDISEMMPSGGG